MNSDNVSCVRSDYASTHPFAPAVLNLAVTTETMFSFANSTGVAHVDLPSQTAITGSYTPTDPNANPAILTSNVGRPGAGYRGGAPYFSSGSFDGRPFLVQLCGKTHIVTAAGGATVVTPKLYQGVSATPGSNSAISSPTGISVPLSHNADVNFLVQATMIWDATSGILQGESFGTVGAFDNTAAALIAGVYTARAVVTSLHVTALANIQFSASMTMLTTAPTSSATTLTELSLCQL